MRSRTVQEQARWWSYARQRLGRRAPGAGGTLRDVIGVYSSHPTAPLSLHARVGSFSRRDFEALETARLSLRLPAMRGSIHVLPHGVAHLAFHATRGALQEYRSLVRVGLITEDGYNRLKREVLLVAREPMSAREIRTSLNAEDEPLPEVLKSMCREGVLLRVSPEGLRSNALRYVATEAWLGSGLPDADPDEALAWLAGEYLRAFGPALVADFRWWAGVSTGRAAAALSTVETIELDGGYLLPAGDLGDFEGTEAPGPDALDVLPKWDCYTMGYAPDGRARFVHPDAQDRVYTQAGDGLGVVLVDGLAAGAWSARFSGRLMEVDLDMFEAPGARLKEAVAERFEEVAAFLGARGWKTTR